MIAMLVAALLQDQPRTVATPVAPPAIVSLEPVDSDRVVAIGQVPPFNSVAPPQAPAVPIPYLVEVTVRVGDQTLFRDVLRVVQGYPASYNENTTQAPMVICPSAPSYESSQRSSLRINLSNLTDRPGRVNLSVHWERPLPPSAVCQLPGTRGVQLSNTVELVRGETVSLEGDAGLRVSLKRH